jgi:DNA-binding NarL/FixJ family response regulator
VYYPIWEDLGRMQAAPAAFANTWGSPRRWLETATERFLDSDLTAPAERCKELLNQPPPSIASPLGITPREAEVLRLVAAGLSNRDIAGALFVSPRTVEKHLESLLRKVGARSRTELVARSGLAGD